MSTTFACSIYRCFPYTLPNKQRIWYRCVQSWNRHLTYMEDNYVADRACNLTD
jgi:hypothetical protein